MALTFQGRTGPAVKTKSRTVANIIYESSSIVEISYVNYYYEPTKNSNPYFFEQFSTGIPFFAVRSNLEFNNLEISSTTNTTTNHYPIGSETATTDTSGFNAAFGSPPITYSSVFDTLFPGSFNSFIDHAAIKTSKIGKHVVLDENDRSTATLPFRHVYADLPEEISNDAIHFSWASWNQNDISTINNSITADYKLVVIVHRSEDLYADAIADLDTFYRKKTSSEVTKFYFQNTGNTTGWQQEIINLRNVVMETGKCLLWLEFIRYPLQPKNPFPVSYAAWDSSLIDNTWYNFSHSRVYPNTPPRYPARNSDLQGWNINTDTVAMEANNNPRFRPIGYVSGEEHENYIFETVVKSTSYDDDAIGVVIGFVFENGYEYTLTAYRSQGGPLSSKTWFVVANAGQSISFTGFNYNAQGSPMPYGLWDNSSSVGFASNSWASVPNGTKIRVEKTRDQVKVYTSPMNSTTIDSSTEIIIPLTGDNARFKKSKIGFSSWGQPLAQWHDVHFETDHSSYYSGGEVGAKLGVLGVGGFALETAVNTEMFANPKSNSQFVEEVTSVKFSLQENEAHETFNMFTGKFTPFNEASNSLNLTNKFGIGYDRYTILDYTKTSMLIKFSEASLNMKLFKEGPLLLGDSSFTGQLLTSDSIGKKIFHATLLGQTIAASELGNNFDRLFDTQQNNTSDNLVVQFQEISYKFDPPTFDTIVPWETFPNVGRELSVAEYVSIYDEAVEKFLGASLYRSNFVDEETVNKFGIGSYFHEQMITREEKSGLYLLGAVDLVESHKNSLQYGPPTDKTVYINYGVGDKTDKAFGKNNLFFDMINQDDFVNKPFFEISSYEDEHNKPFFDMINQDDFVNKPFFEISSYEDEHDKPAYEVMSTASNLWEEFLIQKVDVGLKSKRFFELQKTTILEDTTWKETMRVLEFDFPKTAYFEYGKDIEFEIQTFYTPKLDIPFIHKQFFVDLDHWNKDFKFKPFMTTNTDASFLIEQHYLLAGGVSSPNPLNLFKHLMIEEIFRPNYRDSLPVYEFVMDKFESLTANTFNFIKLQDTFYEPITTNRPSLSGGSNAYGYDVIDVGKTGDRISSHKLFTLEDLVELPGRAGRPVTQKYEEVQIVSDITGKGRLFEFSDVDWDLDANSSFDEKYTIQKEKNNFNFVYYRDQTKSNGRIPDCLTFDNGRLYGKLGDTDRFLRKYSWEDWMTLQGTTSVNGKFTPLVEQLDTDYSDFKMPDPRQWKVSFTGTNITKGVVNVHKRVDLKEFTIGQKISQQSAEGTTTFIISKRLSEFVKDVDYGNGIEEKTIISYEFERLLGGDIDVSTVVESVSSTFTPNSSRIQENISSLQQDLIFSDGTTQAVISDRILSLQQQLSNQSSTDGFISLGISSSSVAYKYVTNEHSIQMVVDDVSLTTAGGLVKTVELIFKIYNNYSYDRDLYLHTNPNIEDSAYNTRADWIAAERKLGHGSFDPQANNNSMDNALLEWIIDFRDSKINIETYLEKQDNIFSNRQYNSPTQKDDYKDFIETLIYKDKKTGVWTVDNNALEITKVEDAAAFPTIEVDSISEMFSLDSSIPRGTFLNKISETVGDVALGGGDQTDLQLLNVKKQKGFDNNFQSTTGATKEIFKLNCEYEVDEQSFYDNVDDVKVIRGYPVYASCS